MAVQKDLVGSSQGRNRDLMLIDRRPRTENEFVEQLLVMSSTTLDELCTSTLSLLLFQP